LYKDKESWIHLCLLEQIYETEPQFKQYEWSKFRAIVNRLMDTLDLEAECFAHDMLGLERYKTINPRPETTARGEPFWDGHSAQALLKLFVAKQDREWKNKTIQRKLLPPEARLKNTAFQAFTLPTFRNHYYREMRALIETQSRRAATQRKRRS
jgi:hypothetical protein